MRPQLAFAFVSLAVLLAPALPALADERPCPDQIEDLCPETEPNSPARRECVRKKSEELTDECRQQLGHPRPVEKPARASVLQGLVDACAADQPKIAKLCPDSTKLQACLVAHEREFSEPCRKGIDAYIAPRSASKPTPKPPVKPAAD